MERKERLIRVLQIIEATDEKCPVNSAQIIDKLRSQYEIINVDRGSIYNDITLLQDCGYCITQCKNKSLGWYMEKHLFEDWELKIMMDAIAQAKYLTKEMAVDIRERLLKISSERGRKRFAHQIEPRSMNMSQDSTTVEYIEKMLEAMFIGRKITFQYTVLDDELKPVIKRDGHIYLLSLFTIVLENGNYYLIGAHDNHEKLTYYRLDRIRNLEITDEIAISAKDRLGENPELILQDHIRKSVNHFSGEKIRVEIEYEPDDSNNAILYDFASDDVKVRKMDNGKCVATFSKFNSVTLVGWLVQYATRYKVIKPESLKEMVIAELKKGIMTYEN